MVCDFTSRQTIFLDVEMLHNNIFGAIEEMRLSVDIEDEKERHNSFEKAFGLQTPMPLDDNIMVVHIRSNLLLFKHKKVVHRWAKIKHP